MLNFVLVIIVLIPSINNNYGNQYLIQTERFNTLDACEKSKSFISAAVLSKNVIIGTCIEDDSRTQSTHLENYGSGI